MRIQLHLPPDPLAPRLARDRVAGLMGQLPGKKAEDVRLLVTELVTNAVKHAGLRPEETIGLTARVRPTRIDVLVRYPEHAGFGGVLPLEPSERSGWGLFLVDRLSDRWSVVQTRGLMEAWFEIDLPSRVAA